MVEDYYQDQDYPDLTGAEVNAPTKYSQGSRLEKIAFAVACALSVRMVNVSDCWSVGPCSRTGFNKYMYASVILDEGSLMNFLFI